MSAPDLAALSEAATRAMDEALALADANADPNMILVARCKSAVWHDRLAYTLVNAYRSGDLVLIDREGMRVKMAAAMAVSQGADEDDAEIWFPEADAAIAAILGGANPGRA